MRVNIKNLLSMTTIAVTFAALAGAASASQVLQAGSQPQMQTTLAFDLAGPRRADAEDIRPDAEDFAATRGAAVQMAKLIGGLRP